MSGFSQIYRSKSFNHEEGFNSSLNYYLGKLLKRETILRQWLVYSVSS